MFKVPIILTIIWFAAAVLADERKPSSHFIVGLIAIVTAASWLLAIAQLLWSL